MPKPLNSVLAQIAEAKIPSAILVGGSSDYLSEQAFRDIRDAIVAARPGIAIESFEAGTGVAPGLDPPPPRPRLGSGGGRSRPGGHTFASPQGGRRPLAKATAGPGTAHTGHEKR